LDDDDVRKHTQQLVSYLTVSTPLRGLERAAFGAVPTASTAASIAVCHNRLLGFSGPVATHNTSYNM
jgi:hypothetical protein